MQNLVPLVHQQKDLLGKQSAKFNQNIQTSEKLIWSGLAKYKRFNAPRNSANFGRISRMEPGLIKMLLEEYNFDDEIEEEVMAESIPNSSPLILAFTISNPSPSDDDGTILRILYSIMNIALRFFCLLIGK